MFQSTHLHEVWRTVPKVNYTPRCFNPHTYMRCDLSRKVRFSFGILFQSTHLHEVWLRLNESNLFEYIVSIHTPTWGVTLRNGIEIIKDAFQSTHLHEVWPLFDKENAANSCFNPHTYMRCDVTGMSQSNINTVSIHTPTWGVTPIHATTSRYSVFQSTHLHEVWRLFVLGIR